MKRDASGRPVKETEEDQKQGGQKQSSQNPADGSRSPTAPTQTPKETELGQKGNDQSQGGQTNQGTQSE